MNRLLLSGLFALLSLAFLGCTPADRFTVGGVPKWVSEGAKLDDEPAPYRPDPAIINHSGESGPIEFEFLTDSRVHEAPQKKKTKSSTSDPIERGRDSRIRRLFR